MENKKRKKLIIILSIIIGLLLVGFGSYFVIDKYFSKDDVVDKNDVNQSNDETDVDNEEVNIIASIDFESEQQELIMQYDDNFDYSTIEHNIVVNNFKLNEKSYELVLKVGAYDESNNNYEKSLSIYLDDKFVAEVNIISNSYDYSIHTYKDYFMISAANASGANLFILSSQKLEREISMSSYEEGKVNFDNIVNGIISRNSYEKLSNYTFNVYEEKFDLSNNDIDYSKILVEKVNCKSSNVKYEYKGMCGFYFNIWFDDYQGA